jgi:hypothetical protein
VVAPSNASASLGSFDPVVISVSYTKVNSDTFFWARVQTAIERNNKTRIEALWIFMLFDIDQFKDYTVKESVV